MRRHPLSPHAPQPHLHPPQQQQHQVAHKPFRFMDPADADTTTCTAALTTSVPDTAAVAAAAPTMSTDLLIAAAKDPKAMDSWTMATATAALDNTVRDCGYGALKGGGGAAPADLAAAASTAASVLKRLASHGGPSPRVAGALEHAAQRLTSAFSGARATSNAPGATAATAAALSRDGELSTRGADSGGGGDSGGGDTPSRAALLTQTASGRVAKVPSASLDLRPHTGTLTASVRAGGTETLGKKQTDRRTDAL
ncbi:hypothetical protein Vafri_1489 [Volvox africanus]|nr:hypothetical protein Vafri_1489 [Volvox africanus]